MDIPAIDERYKIWEVFSEFFLDTELTDLNYNYISSVLAESSYSIPELQDILYYEVYPVCKWNKFSIAGAWAGFSEDWIKQHIAPKKDKRPFLRLAPFHQWMFKEEWKKVRDLIQEKRAK